MLSEFRYNKLISFVPSYEQFVEKYLEDQIDVWCESEQVQSARVYFVINISELRNIRYGL